MMQPAFIHLRVRSVYSLLEGAIGVKELVKWCGKQAMPAVAVADTCNLFGSLEFAQAASDAGIQPIMACVMHIVPHMESNNRAHAVKPDELVLIAQNETGWQNLMQLSSRAFLESASTTETMLDMPTIARHSEGLICLTGGMHGGLARALIAGQNAKAEALLHTLRATFPNRLYIELTRHGVPEEAQAEAGLISLAHAHNLPLIATNDAYFIDEEMFEAHDVFMCISEGTYVTEENRRRLTPHHRLKTPQEMADLFSDVPEALATTVQVARRCSFAAPARKPILPSFVDEDGNADADAMLREKARAGLEARLLHHVYPPGVSEAQKPAIAAPYRERLEFEIDTIINMKFPGYFLIVSDFITWSKQQGIPVGPGRGSGAGSLVAWALNITDLDPLRYGLLFERFLNPSRVSMPDFDVDFCQDRRDEVIAYVQQKYGRDRVAQIITFGKLAARAVLRDVGRVLQMPYGQVDKITKLVPNNPANPVTLEQALEQEPLLKAAMREDETVERLVNISLKLEGLNRHASTHAAGVVIGDRPLAELAPLYRDPKSDMPVVQYSMKYAESAGLVKFDFLGLKTLSVLVAAVKMIPCAIPPGGMADTPHRTTTLDLLKLPEGDRKTYDMLSRGETLGVFQLESAGMRDTLRKLRPDTLEDIIALVSLYRPGPMDNIPTYIARKHGHEAPDYLHPRLEPILKETFGVIIYQEQVMQIAQVLAGYSLGEADLLRRAMGKKIKSEMEAQREIFVEKSVANGVEKKQAASIFDLIAKFAEYGFNKSHAAAYAVIAYQTAFLKANHTQEFIAASMTYDMHNTDKLGVFREDAARYGIKLRAPDVNKSGVYFTVENGHIRYALAAVRNVGEQAMREMVAEREANGPFKSIFDFAARAKPHTLNKRALEFLIKAGAFDSLHTNRAQLFASLDMIVAYAESIHRDRESAQVSLFGGAGEGAGLSREPTLPQVQDWPNLEKLHAEFEAIGFYLSAHPLDSYKRALSAAGVTPSALLAGKLGAKFSPVKVAGIVTGKKIKSSEKGRFAFVQLTDASGVFECSVFNEELLNRQRDKLEVGRVLLITADGKQDDSGIRLIAQSIADLDEEMKNGAFNKDGGMVRIVVNNDKAILSLRESLGLASPKGADVTLVAHTGSGALAELKLPGKYSITPVQLDQIRVILGVVEAVEV